MVEHPFGRLRRQAYYPQWGDEKHRLAIFSAAHRIWPDWSDDELREFVDRILHETACRSLRVAGGGDGSPQPYSDAEVKVWRRMARRYGADDEEVEALDQAVQLRYRGRPKT